MSFTPRPPRVRIPKPVVPKAGFVRAPSLGLVDQGIFANEKPAVQGDVQTAFKQPMSGGK